MPEADFILKLHRRGKKGTNIWQCELKELRKTRKVRGYILDNPP
ncbi:MULTISPECIES: conjugal transfer nickase/helicase domain-containing protein [Lonsdalea]